MECPKCGGELYVEFVTEGAVRYDIMNVEDGKAMLSRSAEYVDDEHSPTLACYDCAYETRQLPFACSIAED